MSNNIFQGGTSGIGAEIVYELASRGAQIILLTRHNPSDLFLVDYISDLRESTKNQLIYAEKVDLTSLHSIRTFATKWVDNAPPRRLDMLILCANTITPSPSVLGGNPRRRYTADGLDEEWQVNYLANFHLLSILSPAIRAQPPDRDVRIIFGTCSSYIGGQINTSLTEGTPNTIVTDPNSASIPDDGGGNMGKNRFKSREKNKPNIPSSNSSTSTQITNMYSMTKLSLMIFAQSFQKHLSSYKRPDKHPMTAKVLLVDPGFCRTPGTRRWLTGGSLWGLFIYLLTWPFWWLVLKSPQQGAQSFLYAAMEARFGRGEIGGWYLKECREVEPLRKEVRGPLVTPTTLGARSRSDQADPESMEIARQLWEFSEKQIERKEKEAATRRALEKKEMDRKEKQSQETRSGTNEPLTSSVTSQTPGSRRSRKTR